MKEKFLVTDAQVTETSDGSIFGVMTVARGQGSSRQYVKLRTFNKSAECPALNDDPIGSATKDAIISLTRERDEWKAKAEQGPQASDEKWNGLVEFWQKKSKATEHLADTCGTLRTANMELLAENAQLRRRLEKLERKK